MTKKVTSQVVVAGVSLVGASAMMSSYAVGEVNLKYMALFWAAFAATTISLYSSLRSPRIGELISGIAIAALAVFLCIAEIKTHLFTEQGYGYHFAIATLASLLVAAILVGRFINAKDTKPYSEKRAEAISVAATIFGLALATATAFIRI